MVTRRVECEVCSRDCDDNTNDATAPRAMRFGTLADGRTVELLPMRNSHGIELTVITYGAIITSLHVPDASGRLDDVVLGHDNVESYEKHSPYLGAVVGRYANRIADGAFTLDGVSHHISRNETGAALHGGVSGFDKAVWKVEAATPRLVRLAHTSPAGDQGFPGGVRVRLCYSLSDSARRLEIEYEATSTAATVVNLTQHTYWNLGGANGESVLDHELQLWASSFTPTDSNLIPTGEIRAAGNTPFDFRSATPIGARIGDDDEQLRFGSGYDHNFVLDRRTAGLSHAAALRDPRSGRHLEVLTTEPGLQLYSGNHLDGGIIGKNGIPYERYAGVCLETQHFPDSPNRPEFPSTVLRPGETFRSTTAFIFS